MEEDGRKEDIKASADVAMTDEPASDRGSRACFDFRDTGTCRFGAECHFSHDIDIILAALNTQQSLVQMIPPPAYYWNPSGAYDEESKLEGASAPAAAGATADDYETADEEGRPPKKPKIERVKMTCYGCAKNLNEDQYLKHITGRAHMKKITSVISSAPFSCQVCVLIFDTDEQQTEHASTALHAERLSNPLPKPVIKSVKAENPSANAATAVGQTTAPASVAPVYFTDTDFVTRCTLCNVDFTSDQNRDSHLQGKRHKKLVASSANPSLQPKAVSPSSVVARCDVCDISFTQDTQHTQHIAGKRHLKAVQKANGAHEPVMPSAWSKQRGRGGMPGNAGRKLNRWRTARGGLQGGGGGYGYYTDEGPYQEGPALQEALNRGGRGRGGRGGSRGGRGTRGFSRGGTRGGSRGFSRGGTRGGARGGGRGNYAGYTLPQQSQGRFASEGGGYAGQEGYASQGHTPYSQQQQQGYESYGAPYNEASQQQQANEFAYTYPNQNNSANTYGYAGNSTYY